MNGEEAKKAKRVEPSAEIDQLATKVIGAVIEVHKLLGPGYLEAVYEEAMCIEMAERGIPFRRQVSISVDYKGHRVGEGRIDLFVGEKLIVELKAVEALQPIHDAQALSYLKATRCPLALLINFNTPVLRDGIKRKILS